MDEAVIDQPLLHAGPGSLRAWLREETAEAHAAAERAVMRALTPIAAPHYAAYLKRLLALYEALEPTLWSACGRLVPDRAARSKVEWLRADLEALGEAPGTAARPCPLDLRSSLEWLGAAYVIEGATLGGPVLLARLQAAGLLLQRDRGGGRFLSGYGASNAAMWRAFRRALSAAAPDPRDWPQLRSGARAMFDSYEGAVAGAGAP